MMKSFYIILFVLFSCEFQAQTPGFFDAEPKLGQVIVRQIIYDFNGSAHVLNKSYPAMDSIVLYLKNNPNVKLEIGNYVDQRGNDDFNLRLTEIRAKRAKDYLVQKGIDAERITTIGYGETSPVYSQEEISTEREKEKQEALYLANRRTTFKIIGL